MGPYATSAHPGRDGRGPALPEDLHPPLVRHAAPGQVRDALPDGRLRPRAEQDRARPRSSTRSPRPRNPPKTIAIVTSKFPSAQFQSDRAPARWPRSAASRSSLYLEYEFGTRDWGADRRAREGRQRRLPLGRRARPRRQPAPGGDEEARLHAAAALPPVPGAGPAGAGARRQAGALASPSSRSTRRSRANPGAARLVPLFHERATKANVPYPNVDTQAAGSFAAWQVLEAAVTATKSLDDKVLGAVAARRTGSTRSSASCASTGPTTTATTSSR